MQAQRYILSNNTGQLQKVLVYVDHCLCAYEYHLRILIHSHSGPMEELLILYCFTNKNS